MSDDATYLDLRRIHKRFGGFSALEGIDLAIRRGELPAGTDVELAMDLLAGPVYWRLAVMQVEVTDEYCDRLAAVIVAALTNR